MIQNYPTTCLIQILILINQYHGCNVSNFSSSSIRNFLNFCPPTLLIFYYYNHDTLFINQSITLMIHFFCHPFKSMTKTFSFSFYSFYAIQILFRSLLSINAVRKRKSIGIDRYVSIIDRLISYSVTPTQMVCGTCAGLLS